MSDQTKEGSGSGEDAAVSQSMAASVSHDKAKVNFTQPGDLIFYPDNPTHASHKFAFKNKEPSQFYDPCAEASQMSMKCLERNNYDRDSCIPYFQTYRDCKKEFTRFRKKQISTGAWYN